MRSDVLFQGLEYKYKGDFPRGNINGLCLNSKETKEKDLFIDLSGSQLYAEEAIRKGAIGVLSKKLLDIDGFVLTLDHFEKDVVHVIKKFFNNPSDKLFMIGVTGTSGKTTITYFVYHILNKLHRRCGLMGSIEVITKKTVKPATLTTPDIISCYVNLKEMVESKLENCCMEVSSHGIDQRRIAGIHFHCAVFTNLTHEHLDYHKTFCHYKQTKKNLFLSLKENSSAVLNADDLSYDFMSEDVKANITTYAIRSEADYRAKNIKLSLQGTSFDLIFNKKIYKVKTALIGLFNVYNTLATIATCHQKNINLDAIIQAAMTFRGAKGRLEKLENEKGYHIYIDHAHKPDALENVLKTLRGLSKGKLITVVGCGGDRDQQKRPLMAFIAKKYSDYIVLTSDNPRSEDPLKIIRQMQAGLKETCGCFCLIERDKAIQKAIELASIQDTILIAGKGHESYQIINGINYPFSDFEIARDLLNKN